jgi:hypothetical protein
MLLQPGCSLEMLFWKYQSLRMVASCPFGRRTHSSLRSAFNLDLGWRQCFTRQNVRRRCPDSAAVPACRVWDPASASPPPPRQSASLAAWVPGPPGPPPTGKPVLPRRRAHGRGELLHPAGPAASLSAFSGSRCAEGRPLPERGQRGAAAREGLEPWFTGIGLGGRLP